jgi:uncharacterized membrane protein YfcA
MATDLFALTPADWMLPITCALLVGMSKAGLPGLGTIAVPLMAMVFPPTMSTGILLPILITGDIFGVVYYHRHTDWKLLWRLIPAALAGVVIGFFMLKQLMRGDIDRANEVIRIGIGSLILALVALNLLREKLRLSEVSELPPKWAMSVAIAFGLLAGITTQVANAAGPITLIYLLAMKLPKEAFIGTGTWYSCIINWCKVPFMIGLGSINKDSLIFNLKLVPFVLIGTVLAIAISSKMSRKSFEKWIILLTIVAALKLLLK